MKKKGRTMVVVAVLALATVYSGCPIGVGSDNGTAVIQVGDTGPAGGIVF